MKKPILLYNPNVTSKTVLVSENCWANRLLSFWLFRYAVIILSCISIIILSYRYYAPSFKTNNSRTPVIPTWDFLLFTQSYPLTCCIWWENTKHTERCNLPQDEHAWTIHGIWPTKVNSEGPNNCRNVPFNETVLEPIKNELHEHWCSMGVGYGDDLTFWKHEWKKHGTCAISDELFDSELTYFQLGLKWNRQWNLEDILKEAGITPSNTDTYQVTQFHDAISKKLGKSPYLDCYYYEDLGIYLINEIRLCIGKDLTLLDCDELYPVNNRSTCRFEEVFYPEALTITDKNFIKRKTDV